MTDQLHDYSKHTAAEIEQECVILDPAKYPERAKSLQLELLKRFRNASASAATAASSHALSVGAQYDQLEPQAARSFFWPFIGVSFLFSFVAGFLVSFVASFTVGVLASFGALEQSSLAARGLQLAITLPLAIPVATLWLKVFTRRWFGGYGLRLVRAGARDAA